jgi:uncharacterized membrane protein YgdD (TMEM256/DUF423 family)
LKLKLINAGIHNISDNFALIFFKYTKKMDRKILSTASIFGLIAIVLGAFGAHALKKVLDFQELNTFETGVKYQLAHALFLLFLGTNSLISQKRKTILFYLTFFGVFLFSGSIYLLATNRLTIFDFRVIGFVTPIGGLLLILAWSILFLSFITKKNSM